MRIIKIEMENLNSLKGHWSIDFTNPDYETFHNLFVISGYTGSGKTTILDAITLALYGKTPRQNTVTKKGNEIMTRRTGFCSAKITYICKAGKFESEFYQQRARKNPEGDFQPPECRIKNLDDGTEKTEIAVSNLEAETEKIIQLNYDQFSRSIMLAQGQFDTFIKGDERERASILSKLNGTEQYREIGRRICEKASETNREFEEAGKKLKDFELFSEEEIQGFIKEQSDKTKENVALKKKIDEINKALTWLDELGKCEIDFKEADLARKAYEEKQKDFKEKSSCLLKAEKAEKCSVSYNALQTVLDNIKSKEDDNRKNSEVLIEVQKDYTLAEENFNKKNKDEGDAEKQKAKDSELWKTVRDFDSKLKPLFDRKKDAEKTKNIDADKLKTGKSILVSSKNKVAELEETIKKCSDFISSHKNYKDLDKTCILLGQKKVQVLKILKEIKKAADEIADNDFEISAKEKEEVSANEELLSVQEELKKLVSREFLSVSLLLRNQLEKGKACPVCGSKEHPSCDSAEKPGSEADEKSGKVAVDVASLNKKLEKAEKQLSDIKNRIDSLKKESERISSEKSGKEASLKSEQDEINGLIKGFDLSVSIENEESSEKSFDEIIKKLSGLFETYSQFEKDKTDSEVDLKSYSDKIENINMEELEKAASESQKAFDDANDEFTKVNDNRKKLFGDRNPDDEEKNAESKIAELKEALSEAEIKKNDLLSRKNGIETTILNNEKDIQKFEEERKLKQKAFDEAVSKNGFSSEKEFLESRMSEDEISDLKNTEETLKSLNVETDTALKNADNRLKEKQKEKCTGEKRENLLSEKVLLEKQQTDNSERVGKIKDMLSNNEKDGQKFAKAKEIYDEAKKQNDLWQAMKKFIGKSTGEDFEVFVEALAFKQLLRIANRYVEAITGKYTLVQVENKVDFLVHDSHFPDHKDDRPVSNMSGGEKFVISLSLALGISELASRNVRVDSLFLDEGFGTLSGTYLTEAIVALKSLQSSGKMLGIITHMDSVIREFDLKIRTEQTLTGQSVIKGPGVLPVVED